VSERFSRTVGVATAVAVVFMFGLVVRLWQLQVVKGGEYSRLAFENRLRAEKVPAPRGIIFDRYGTQLVRNAAYFNVTLSPGALVEGDILEIADFLHMRPEDVGALVKGARKSIEPVVVKDGLSFPELAYVEARLSDYPALGISVEQSRSYPFGGVGAHLIGYLGKLGPRQARQEEYREVPPEAFVGQWGVERMFDETLRGEPGERVIEVDALGRELRIVGERAPRRGRDVRLSLDMEMQRQVAAAFGNRAGAFVAIRPATGELLGLVSSPSFNPNLFSRGIAYADWAALATDGRFPMLNRALQSQYPPGSTFKVVTGLAALAEGAVTQSSTFTCTGGIRSGAWRFGCWKRGGHGTLSFERAVVESCDVYFYLAGERAGIDAIARYARALGLGRPSGVGIVEEKAGLIPDTAWKKRARNAPWYRGETYNAAIGQGYVLTTPIQLARMIAAIADEGRLRPVAMTAASASASLPAPLPVANPEAIAALRDALVGVVNWPNGTAYSSRSKIAVMGGKTGTAQVYSQKGEDYDEDTVPEHLRDHAWFIAFAPAEAPEIAVAVLVEHGGHGGSVAAPIARLAIETYLGGLESHKAEVPGG
jgi:penicillin-binding protein 2